MTGSLEGMLSVRVGSARFLPSDQLPEQGHQLDQTRVRIVAQEWAGGCKTELRFLPITPKLVPGFP